MANIYHEILSTLKNCGKMPDEVQWVGSNDGVYAITFEEFAAIADFEYDDPYETRQGVPADMVIVGEDWWLERDEYHGKWGWRYKEKPARTEDPLTFNKAVDKNGAPSCIAELTEGKDWWKAYI